jgi:hypothetical protein
MTDAEILESHRMYIRNNCDRITIAQHFGIHPEQLSSIWVKNTVRDLKNRMSEEQFNEIYRS